MADPFADLLGQVGQGTPEASDQAFDELLGQATGVPQEDFSGLLEQVGGNAPLRGWQGAGQLFWQGVQRNFRNLQATPAGLRAQVAALQGDVASEMLAAQEAQSIEEQAPKAQWSLKDVTNVEDFGYWLTERFGENSLTLLTAMAGGAGGAVVGGLAARGLGGSLAARAAATRAGMLAGAFGTSAPVETAATGGEQFEVTGSVQPQLSIPAGVAKGLLELWTPAKLLSALSKPGLQLGRTLPAAVAGGMAREGVTEGLQESIDIAARMYSDPAYSFFAQGPELALGEGGWRLLEASVAGAALGGAFGGVSGVIERRQEARSPESGLQPGEIEVVQRGGATPPPAGLSSLDMRTWQGSPHDFTEHSNEAIGTGEGAAAYAYGHYVAGNPETGKYYQNSTSRHFYDEKPYDNSNPAHSAAYVLHEIAKGKRSAAENYLTQALDQLAKVPNPTPAQQQRAAAHQQALQILREGKEAKRREGANLYEIEMDLKPEELLDWDKPLSEQPPAVQAKLQALLPRAIEFGKTVESMRTEPPGSYKTDPAQMTGEDLYRQLATKKEAAELLYAAGIPGVQYLDQDSRAPRYVGLLDGKEVVGGDAAFDTAAVMLYRNNGDLKEAIRELTAQNEMYSSPEMAEAIKLLQSGRVTLGDAPKTWNYVVFPGAVGKLRVLKKNDQPIQQAALRSGSKVDIRVPETPAEDGQPGPITTLNQITRQPSYDVGLQEATIPQARNDLFDAGPLLRSALPEPAMEAYLDFLDANTKRYVLEDQTGRVANTVFTDTALEHELTVLPQNQKPKVHLVDQTSLVPAGITATLEELPTVESRRIWFLPGVTAQEQTRLLAEYEVMRTALFAEQAAWLQSVERRNVIFPYWAKQYDALLSQGLRVLPPRGGSFYYMGSVELRTQAVEPPSTSGRAPMWAFLYRQELISATRGDIYLGFPDAPPSSGLLPVTVDLNQFKPGEVSILPRRAENGSVAYYEWEGFEPHKYAEQQAFANTVVDPLIPQDASAPWAPENIAKFRQLMKKGFYIAPTGRALQYARGLVTAEPLSLDKLVPGVNKWDIGIYHYMTHQQESARPKLPQKELTLMPFDPAGFTPSEMEQAKKVHAAIARWVPAARLLMQDLGFDTGGFQIELTNDSTYISVAAADYTRGLVIFNTTSPYWRVDNPAVLSAQMWSVLTHELGHLNSFFYYTKLPVEIQQQLYYAYNKTLLAYRNNVHAGTGRLTMLDAAAQQQMLTPDYYARYVEWMAEQFRRFATSDAQVRTQLEGVFAEGARQLDELYARVQKHNPKTAVDLLNPDYYYSAYMQYLRDYGKTKEKLKQLERRQALYAVDEDIYESPMVTKTLEVVINTLESMKPMFPENHPFKVLFSNRLDQRLAPVDPDAIGRAIFNVQNKTLMELAVGSLPAQDAMVREVFAHELIHVYKHLGLITPQEMNVLYTSAVKEGKMLPPSEKLALRRKVEEEGKRYQWDDARIQMLYAEVLREETVAYYVGEYARTGMAPVETKTLLDRILEVLRRIRDALMGVRWSTRDDILHAFFKGEMLSRDERAMQNSEIAQNLMRSFEPDLVGTITPTEVVDFSPEYELRIAMEQNAKGERIGAVVQWFDKALQEVVGHQQIAISEGRGFNVEMQYSNAPGTALHWLQALQQHFGLPLLAPQVFTRAGMRAASRLYPQLKQYYVEGKGGGHEGDYYSPKYIKQMVERWTENIRQLEQASQDRGIPVPKMHGDWIRELEKWKGYLKKVPADIWTENKHLLDQLFMLQKNRFLDGVQGAAVREAAQESEAELKSILGEPAGRDQSQDSFELAFAQKMEESQQTAAQKLGIDYSEAAPEQPLTRNIRRILAWADRTGATTDPRYVKYLKRVGQDTLVSQEADRIGHFSKLYWGLRQLIWRNEHLTGLQMYGQRVEQYAGVISSWHREADDIARTWEQELNKPGQRQNFNKLMYWLADMDYLTPPEWMANVVRHPTRAELEAKLAALKLNVPEVTDLNTGILWQLYQPPWHVGTSPRDSVFARFLKAVEDISVANITSTISDPTTRAKAILEVQNEMNELRARPYFPITRFGQHTITVRDGDPSKNNRVLHFEAYETHTARDAALEAVARRFPMDHIHKGRLPEEYIEFLGLPGPLIREVRNNMPNLQPDQIAWLEELERQNLPDKAFRARWKPRGAVTGYSMDSFRSFAHYFMHGSRYLARMQYRAPMLQSITSVEASIPGLPNGSKRRMIVDYMKRHYNYLMEGGRDWAKFKALVALWQLGFSPAAAFMNFTQTPMVSLPWLNSVFGNTQGLPQITKSIAAVRNLRDGFVTSGVGKYAEARQEMIRQGRIDIGQAAELGAFAEGSNLLGLLAGTRRQKLYRNFTWYGMWMFQRAEQANREIMMHAVWELAHKQARTNKRIKEIDKHYFVEISELQARLGWTAEDAVAFILAKEALDQTQGLYAPYARPTFMRSPAAGTLLIFYQFVQMMTYAFRYNPGLMQMWFLMAVVYGVSGIPGAEDLSELFRTLGKKLWGADFDALAQARKVVREVTRGTIFDEVGPDLVLHGVSRFGFGLGLLPDGYAIGQFDASANGSMGKLVPGLYETLHGINTAAKFDRVVSDVAQRAAGAGFGWFFNMAQFAMESPGSVDGHRWEQSLPRALRAMAAGYRYLPEGSAPQLGGLRPAGGHTLPSGGRLVSFNPTDPEDVAAIVGQFLGFRPAQVTMAQERRRELIELREITMARRTTLMVQLTAAIQAQQATVQADVMGKIERYNEEMAARGTPELGITRSQLNQSIRSRERTRLLDEEGVPAQKMFRNSAEQLKDLFPAIKPQRVR